MPKRCPICRKAEHEKRKKEAERLEGVEWQRRKAAEKELFDRELKEWNVIPLDEVSSENNHVLYIIGNGFDLMHGVRSSYYAFRDSLGKQSHLRTTLEYYLTPEDIWADFEDALAHFNVRAMGSKFIVDNCLDMFDAYDQDAGATDFFMAVETAADPIITVAEELPRRFQKWVETLSIGTADRPLENMFQNGKVLCFNYTEFVETLYGIPKENVCYIHGCRRKKKYHPKERLVLGHLPGASDGAFDFEDDSSLTTRNQYKLYMVEAAQDYVFRLIAARDEELTKNCDEIIAAHEAFFKSLKEVENVIVIGHSLSFVDWDYFSEVAARLSDDKNVRWYFGCHGSRDLKNLKQLLRRLGISRSLVSVFRTDLITVSLLKCPNPVAKNQPAEKVRCTSPSGRWAVKTIDHFLTIVDREKAESNYEAIFSTPISNAFFDVSEKHLFMIIRGVDPGILLFNIEDDQWKFVAELESMAHQSLINPRLNHVFLAEQDITFVYNNRVRRYSLMDGELIYNEDIRGARNRSYDGMEISRLFLKREV